MYKATLPTLAPIPFDMFCSEGVDMFLEVIVGREESDSDNLGVRLNCEIT